jgi:hypothetical protein
MRRLGVPLVTIVALNALWTPSARGADTKVTFSVPVQLQNLHPDAKPEVHCKIVNATFLGVVSYQRQPVPLSGTGFQGQVKVDVPLTQSQAEQAAGWACELWIYPKQGGPGGQPTQGAATNPIYQAQPGTSLVTKVQGKF